MLFGPLCKILLYFEIQEFTDRWSQHTIQNKRYKLNKKVKHIELYTIKFFIMGRLEFRILITKNVVC